MPVVKQPHEIFKKLFRKKALLKVFKEKFEHTKTKGIDNVNGSLFSRDVEDNVEIIVRKINLGSYKYTSYQQILKSKGKDKLPRVISLPSVRDRLVLHQLKEFLGQLYPIEAKPELANTIVSSVISYINLRNPIEEFEVIKIDVCAFYDDISHELLFRKLKDKIHSKKILNLIERALSNPCIPKGIKPTSESINKKGVYQGLSISNLLASIFVNTFDSKYVENHNIFYRRYVDDILVIAPKGTGIAIYKEIKKDLSVLKLKIHPLNEGKSVIHALNMPFDYLGYRFEGKLVTVKKASIDRFLAEISSMLTFQKYFLLQKKISPTSSKLDTFIEEINEKITGAISKGKKYGWVSFFSEVNDRRTLAIMDAVVRKLVCNIPQLKTRIHEIKTLSRAIYEAKYRPSKGYLVNYDAIISTIDKVRYLKKRGKISEHDEETMTESEINELYTIVSSKYLSRLEMDDGLRS